MVSDNNIDKQSAKYWCIFADKDLKSHLDKAKKFGLREGKNLKAALVKAEREVERLEGESQVQEDGTRGPLDGNTFMGNFMNPQNMVGMSGNPFCPNLRQDAPLSLEDQQRNTVIAGAVVAAGAAVVASPGAWGALGAAVIGLINSTSWLAGIVAHVGLAGLSAGVTAAIGGLVSISAWLYPRMAKWVRDIRRTGIVAKCEFKADGVPYKAVYSMSKSKWQLLYGNNRWFRRGTKVDELSVDNFFRTDFFKTFVEQCKKHMDVVFGDAESLELVESLAKIADKESGKTLMQVIKSKDSIKQNMYAGLYMSEAEQEQ